MNPSKNFTLYHEPQFQGYPVYTSKGPLIKQYLERCFDTLHQALIDYPRTFAIRVDLHFPQEGIQQYDHNVLNRFFKSLREQIKHNRELATRKNPYAHQSKVRYLWCKEQYQSNAPHYHVLLLFNADAFDSLGSPTSTQGNMAARIKKAWLSALGYQSNLDVEQYGSLVHFCDNGTYKVNVNNDDGSLANLVYRVSYFCKAETKRFECHQHYFGRSNG